MKIRTLYICTFFRPKVVHRTIEIAASRKSEVAAKTLCGKSGTWFSYGFLEPQNMHGCWGCDAAARKLEAGNER